MNYRALGSTGLEVSEIGYGAWGIAGDAWLGAEDERSLKALHRAVDLGLNFIDTALAYGEGHSERLVGKIVAERDERIYVATKIPPRNQIWPAPDGVPVGETVDGYVQGWDRWNADGTYAGGNVHVDVSGTFYSAAASVPFRETTRSLDVGHPDGSDTGSVRGLMLLVVVPGQSAAVNAGRLVVTFPPGGGEPTFDVRVGLDSDDAFFGSGGHPGTLCMLLAG